MNGPAGGGTLLEIAASIAKGGKEFLENYLPSFEEKRGSLGNKVINEFKNLDNINKETAYQSLTGDKGTLASKLETLGTELTKEGQIPKTAENIKNVKTVLDDVSSTLDATLSTEKGIEAINKHHITPYEYFNTGNSSIDMQRKVTAGVIAGAGTIGTTAALINHRNNNRPY
jgi:hypothetical protein